MSQPFEKAPKRAPAEPFVSLQLLPLSIVVEGSLVMLECEFTLPDSAVPAATPDDNVHWSFESSNAKLAETLPSTSSRTKVEGALVRSKLVIEHVQPSDQAPTVANYERTRRQVRVRRLRQ